VDAFLDAAEADDKKDVKPPFAPDTTATEAAKKEEPIDAAEPILGQEQVYVDVPKPPPPPIVVNDNRLVSDNFPDWRNFDDQTYATLPGIDIMRSRANTLEDASSPSTAPRARST